MKPIEYDKIIKVGDRNEKLVVVESPRRVPKGRCPIWKVKIRCDCGIEQNADCSKWSRGEFKLCRSCQLIGPNNYGWCGHGEIPGDLFSKIQHNAKRKEVEYSLSKKYLWNLFLKQNRKCALSGLELQFRVHSGEQTASLDRIDSSEGYVKGNVQWVHKDVNKMKNVYKESYYKYVCKLVCERNNTSLASKVK